MSDDPESEESPDEVGDFADKLASICEDAAHAFLRRGVGFAPPDSVPTPLWERERQEIEADLGSDEPFGWINECVSTYLAESANILLAIAALLRARAVTASIDPLVRSTIERVGVVNWLLDNDETITPRKRSIRGSLAWIISLQHYCETLARMGAPERHRKVFRIERKRLDGLILTWYEVERPPETPDDPGSSPSTDRTKWTIEGETYPTFTRLAQLAMARSNVSSGIAAGIYDGHSGFSHPNVIFGNEHRTVSDDGLITFVYRMKDLEKAVRIAMGTFGIGVSHSVSYFDAEPQQVIAQMNEVSDRLAAISVLSDP